MKLKEMLKDARQKADLTQEKLARRADVTASAISRYERGEEVPSDAVIRALAKALDTPAAPLIAAKKEEKGGSTKSKSTKTKTTQKASSAKKTATPASAGITMRVTATEKRLVLAYRDASTDVRKQALALLQGKEQNPLESVLGSLGSSGKGDSATSGGIGDLLGDLLGGVLGGK